MTALPSRRCLTIALICAASAGGLAPARAQPVTPPAVAPVPPPPPPPAADPVTPQQQAPATSRGPASVADLAESLLDSVVNVSTSQNVEGVAQGLPRLEAPEGSPLQDFFDDLLKDGDKGGSQRVQSLGSGFVVDASGIIITNNHVIADADEISVNFSDGSKLDATVLGKDTKTDIAVLKVLPPKPLKAVKFGNSDKLRIGDWVMAIGNPFGLGGSVTVGIVSARGRNINAGPYDNFIQTDAAINRGNSGGPLFDMNGEVVGINTAIISPTGGSIGIGFSIPATLAVNVVNQLREFGETRRGWLGIRLQAVTDEIAEGFGLSSAKGAIVMGVVPGGPSDKGLLKVGDVITSFDGREVESSHDLPRIVAETPVGKTVKVEVLRKGAAAEPPKPVTVDVTLGRLEDGEQAMNETGSDKGLGGPPSGQENEERDGDVSALGMTLAEIDDKARQEYSLGKEISGVVVTGVAPASSAAEKGIQPGTVIKEVAQEGVTKAKDVETKIAALRSSGRKNALLLLSSNTGDLRFVVVPLD
ncbi:DegQ family serine endoprotease [Mangrovicella endophytica]|uniref:DegQ family serine endoprotease n=1 Tax=Mangrovicella endophytica TaxID=2066697 RepID=UPI000C9DD620|nr:DegQ family serine endoprotease [Mangrovicella endophytica]